MAIIDKKGNVFGVINLFDLFFIIMLMASAFFAVRWIAVAEDPSWIRVKLFQTRCIVTCSVPPYVADLIKEGDELLNSEGAVVGRIDKVLGISPAAVKTYSSKDGEKIYFDSESVTAKLVLDLQSYEKGGEVYSSIAAVPIKVGGGIFVNTNKYSTQTAITKVLK